MSKYRIQSILFVFIAFMLGCNEYMIVGVLPDISREIGASLSSLGYLVTVFALVYALSTPLVTSLTRYLKRHQLLYLLLVIFLLGNTWTALSTNYLSLLLSRIMSATTAGAIISLVLVIANFVAPLDKRASLLSWIFAGFSIASIIGLPIGTLISTTWSWHASFWLISVLTVVVLILVCLYVPKDTPQAAPQKGQKQLAIFKDPNIRLVICFVILTCAAQYTYYTYIRSLITDYMQLPASLLNLLLLLLGVAFIIGNKSGGLLADHGGLRHLPMVYLLQTLLLLLVNPLFKSAWLAFAAVFLVCVCNASYGAALQVYFLDTAAKDYPQSMDLASSFNSIFANVGISLGSFTAARVAGLTSIGQTTYFGAVFSFLATCLIWLAARRLRAKEAHE